MTGGVQSAIFGVRHYFTLRHENELLSERIADLEMELAVYREQVAAAGIDSLQPHIDELSQYRYTTARIVSNSIARDRNYITLNRGIMHGVTENMAVISPDGVMVGYVIGCSERYSVVMPLLNIDFRTSGKIAGDDHFGSISWGGGSPYKMEMTELSKYADIEVGDEVVSSGLSHYFPEGVKIGYVESYSLNDTQTAYDVVIRLAADVTKISNVIVIENLDYGEVSHLEDSATGGAAAAQ